MAKQLTGSNESILHDIQKDMLPYAFELAKALKLETQVRSFNEDAWYPDGDGIWRGKDISFFMEFSPTLLVRDRDRELGQIRPIGKSKSKKTVAGQFDASDSKIDLNETVTIIEGVTTEVKKIRTNAINYGFEATIGFQVGTEANHVTGEFKSSFGQEITNSDEELINQNNTVQFDSSFTIPAGSKARILTDVTETDIEIDVVDKILMDSAIGFYIFKGHDDDHLCTNRKDATSVKRGGKWYRRAFHVAGLDKLKLTLDGKNSDYPNIPKNNFGKWSKAPDRWGGGVNMEDVTEFFTNRKAMMYEIHGTIERKDSLFGETTLSTD